MNDILYTVHVDGTDKKFKKGTTYQEIARTYQQEYQPVSYTHLTLPTT